jgi:hypothetical protein
LTNSLVFQPEALGGAEDTGDATAENAFVNPVEEDKGHPHVDD